MHKKDVAFTPGVDKIPFKILLWFCPSLLAGFINYGAMSAGLARSYAAASTETGHQAFLGDGVRKTVQGFLVFHVSSHK